MFDRFSARPAVLAGAALMLPVAAAAQATAPVGASQAWIRWLPGDLPVAGYVTLSNGTAKPLELVAASSPAFKRIEFHHSMEMDGMSRMKPVSRVTIPAHGRFRFKPGAYHLMMWRKQDIEPGERVPVTFTFADGSRLTVHFVVKGVTG